MKCENCKLVEMKIKKVEGNKVTHLCPKCNKEVITDLPEKPKTDN